MVHLKFPAYKYRNSNILCRITRNIKNAWSVSFCRLRFVVAATFEDPQTRVQLQCPVAVGVREHGGDWCGVSS